MHHYTVATVGCLAMSLAVQAPVRVAAQRGPVPAGDTIRGGLFPRQLTIFYGSEMSSKQSATPISTSSRHFSRRDTTGRHQMNRPTREQDIWILDLANGTGRPLTSGRALDSAPAWSSDGQEIAYSGTADTARSIVSRRRARDAKPSSIAPTTELRSVSPTGHPTGD